MSSSKFNRKLYDFNRNDEDRTYIIIGLRHLLRYLEFELEKCRGSEVPHDKLLTNFYAEQIVTVNRVLLSKENAHKLFHERLETQLDDPPRQD